MEIRVPKLYRGLNLEPSQTDKQTENDTSLVVLAAGALRSGDYVLSDDPAVRVCQNVLFHLAGDDLFNLIFQAQGNLGNLLRRLRGLRFIGDVRREH